MKKAIVTVLKKISFAFLLLYGFNLIVSAVDILIPINVISVGTVSLLGIPGLLSLVAMYFIIS